MASAPVLGAKPKRDRRARRRRVRRALQRPARARVRPGRAGRAPAGHGQHEDPRARPRRRRQALPPEGHRPRRQGSIRSPQFAGGGTVFGPSPRHYTFKVNRKERRAALRSALSVHAERETVAVLEPGGFETPSTKAAWSLIAEWSAGGSVLVVLLEEQARVALSFRNLERVAVLSASAIGVADVLAAGALLFTEDALTQVAARAKGERAAAPAEETA